MKLGPLGLFFLVCCFVLVWSPAFRAPYLFDDYAVPVSDPASQSLSQWSERNLQSLRPLTKLTFALESELGFREAPARRALNVLLLLTIAGLVFGILLRSGRSQVFAFLGAGLFLVHPLHADNFILLAGRSALLAELFLLASFTCYIEKRFGWSVVCALLAILSRETAMLASGLLIILSFQNWTLPPKRKFSAVILAGALAILPFASAHFRDLLKYSQEYVSSPDHLGLQFAAISRGLMWILIPSGLSIDHDFSVLGIARFAAILMSFLLIMGIGLNYWRLRSSGALALFLAVLVILPTQSLVAKLDPLTERPFATALPLIILGGVSYLSRLRWGIAIQALLAGGILIFGVLTWRRAPLFCDEISIWQEASEASSVATRPLVNLGTLLAQQKRYDEALVALEKAKLRNPVDIEIQEKINAIHVLKQTFEE